MSNNRILGIGIDIEDINRFKRLKLSKDNRFLNRIFTEAELEYCFSKKSVASSLASKYAGKEAVIKACNSVDDTVVDYKKIEITNDVTGAPRVKLISDKIKRYQVMLSLSNEVDKTVGVAIVIG